MHGGPGGRSSGRTSSYLCDYCRKYGHDVAWCYYSSYALTLCLIYMAIPMVLLINIQHSSTPSMVNPRIFTRPYSSYAHMSPYAMNVTHTDQDFNRPSLWYPDSGATNHLNVDPSFLVDPIEQFALDNIYMGNGNKAGIKSCGHAYFQSPLNSKFDPNHFIVKSQATKQALLQVSLTAEGLYAFHNLFSPTSLHCNFSYALPL
ncbi:hypothetical protein Lal_00025560 [Lupinus albus]|nr:hypothetical protein Lal_00025560 [Lupinus albus]